MSLLNSASDQESTKQIFEMHILVLENTWSPCSCYLTSISCHFIACVQMEWHCLPDQAGGGGFAAKDLFHVNSSSHISVTIYLQLYFFIS